jgi:hypothetical protein
MGLKVAEVYCELLHKPEKLEAGLSETRRKVEEWGEHAKRVMEITPHLNVESFMGMIATCLGGIQSITAAWVEAGLAAVGAETAATGGLNIVAEVVLGVVVGAFVALTGAITGSVYALHEFIQENDKMMVQRAIWQGLGYDVGKVNEQFEGLTKTIMAQGYAHEQAVELAKKAALNVGTDPEKMRLFAANALHAAAATGDFGSGLRFAELESQGLSDQMLRLFRTSLPSLYRELKDIHDPIEKHAKALEFMNKMTGATEAQSETAGAAIQRLKNVFTEATLDLGENLFGAWKDFSEFIKSDAGFIGETWRAVAAKISHWWTEALILIRNSALYVEIGVLKIEMAWDRVRGIVTPLWEFMQGAAQATYDIVIAMFGYMVKIGDKLSEWTGGVMSGMFGPDDPAKLARIAELNKLAAENAKGVREDRAKGTEAVGEGGASGKEAAEKGGGAGGDVLSAYWKLQSAIFAQDIPQQHFDEAKKQTVTLERIADANERAADAAEKANKQDIDDWGTMGTDTD